MENQGFVATIYRSPLDGVLGYERPDGAFVVLDIIQDNIFKIYDNNVAKLNNTTDYQIVQIPTQDGISTFRLLSTPEKSITVGGTGGAKTRIFVSDEGTTLGSFTNLNFVGLGVSVSLNGNTATVTINNGGAVIGGGGTLNFIPKFTPDGTHIGDSQLYDNGVSIGFDTTTPQAVATFDIVSTTQGILFPRMTTAQRDLIAVGAGSDSLFIYNTTTNKYNYWDNDAGQWQSIDTHTGTGDVEGSGTTNFITKWTDGPNSTIGDSQVFDNGTNVGIGISAGLLSKLHVAGAIRTGVASTTNGSLVFQNSTNANTVTFNSGATSATYAVTLPLAQGAANSFLMNDGAGTLSWNTGTGLFFAQGGNSFGATARIGTNDANALEFETNNILAATIAVGGAVTFQNSTDTTSGFRILDADGGTPIFNVDTTNERIGINNATPASQLTITSADNSPFNFSISNATFGAESTGYRLYWADNVGTLQLRNNSKDYCQVTANGAVTYTQTVSGNIPLRAIGLNSLNTDTVFLARGTAGTDYGLFVTNAGNVSIGTAANPSARIDVVGSGATSATNTAEFHNSTGTSNSLVIRDDGFVGIGTSSPTASLHIKGQTNDNTTYTLKAEDLAGSIYAFLRNDKVAQFDISDFIVNNGGSKIRLGAFMTVTGSSAAADMFSAAAADLRIAGNPDGTAGTGVTIKYYNGSWLEGLRINNTGAAGPFGNVLLMAGGGNVGIGQSSFGTNADKVLAIGTGTAPTTSPADAFQMYSADQAAGNAAPHFRTEGGAIIKLYQQANIADADGTLADITTKFNTLLGYLDNLGLTA